MCKIEKTRLLNYDCLRHLFLFLTPKDWPNFSKVGKTWNQAAININVEEFKYVKLDPVISDPEYYGEEIEWSRDEIENNDKELKTLNFSEFIKIFEFVAPKLRSAMIKGTTRSQYFEIEDENESGYVYVSFGSFEYLVEVDRNEEKTFMNMFLEKTKNVEKLKINYFDGLTSLEWEQFFHKNPVNYFKFVAKNQHDQTTFFNDFTSTLPSKLQQIGLAFCEDLLTDEDQRQILKLLQKMPLLTKVNLSVPNAFYPMVVNEISQHSNTITELSLGPQLDKAERRKKVNDPEVISSIPNFINLTKLSLTSFSLTRTCDEDVCNQILESCQSIRCLKLLYCDLSRGCVQALMSLPNLSELHINPMQLNLTTEMTNLKKLVIYHNAYVYLDTDNLASALALMPNLSSLTLFLVYYSLTDSSARMIKQTIHSRGQNIVLYSLEHIDEDRKVYVEKVGEIPATPASTKEFAFYISPFQKDEVKQVHEIITKA